MKTRAELLLERSEIGDRRSCRCQRIQAAFAAGKDPDPKDLEDGRNDHLRILEIISELRRLQ
jgi:hypothetical protein